MKTLRFNPRFFTTLAAAAALATLLCGCPKKPAPSAKPGGLPSLSNPAPQPEEDNDEIQPVPDAESTLNRKPAKDTKLSRKKGDYFPINTRMSWKYLLTECSGGICPDKQIDTMISGVKTIDGKTVHTIKTRVRVDDGTGREKIEEQDAASGFVEENGYIYMVLLKDGKIIRKSVAGRHGLKPGDTWKTTVFDTKSREITLVCGDPEYIRSPADDPAPAIYNAICCKSKPASPGDSFTYSACFTAGVGLVAEFYPSAKSEIITYSIKP